MLPRMRPLPPEEAYWVLSPEPIARVDPQRWAHQARTFLDAEVSAHGDLVSDTIELTVEPASRVTVMTFPIDVCPEVIAAANRAVDAIGGAGMDVLVARAQRVWQIPRSVEGDRRAPLVVAALLASVLLGPIVDGEAIYGIRGAKLRLQGMSAA